jgi:hypothetical protein
MLLLAFTLVQQYNVQYCKLTGEAQRYQLTKKEKDGIWNFCFGKIFSRRTLDEIPMAQIPSKTKYLFR